MQNRSVNLYSGQVQTQEKEEAKLSLTPIGYFVLTSQIFEMERQRLWDLLIPLEDLVVKEADLIALAVTA
jgi:hypothetical protein